MSHASPVAAPPCAGVTFDNVSKFYGEVLGVNQVTLTIPPGITSLVGPNGAGKSTLMNLLAGLIQPTRGRIEVLGVSASDPERFFRRLGYATQFDSFPRGMTGVEFVRAFLRIGGAGAADASRLAEAAIARVGMEAAAGRKIAAYSKGMRQRIRLAQALCHDPRVVLLDEPLNGLDPLARAEMVGLFRGLGAEGRTLILSSHILHEVDAVSDQVVMLSNGYVVAEGEMQGVREELPEHSRRIRIRCRSSAEARELAARAFAVPGVIEARLDPDPTSTVGAGPGAVWLTTREARALMLAINGWAVDGVGIEAVQPEEDTHAVYDYLVQPGESAR